LEEAYAGSHPNPFFRKAFGSVRDLRLHGRQRWPTRHGARCHARDGVEGREDLVSVYRQALASHLTGDAVQLGAGEVCEATPALEGASHCRPDDAVRLAERERGIAYEHVR